jgi:hypothetical protein
VSEVEWRKVTARREGSTIIGRIGHAVDRNCTVILELAGLPVMEGEGFDFFEALCIVRLVLEAQGHLLACDGGRENAFPSQMQRQMGRGRFAYVMEYPRTARQLSKVDIFEEALPSMNVATVAEQRAYVLAWRRSPLLDGQ